MFAMEGTYVTEILILVLKWYLAAMNTVAFCAAGYDKLAAIRHAWRIPEKTLFALAALGGAGGLLLGMLAFRHKIRKWYFLVFVPLLAAGWAIAVVLCTR